MPSPPPKPTAEPAAHRPAEDVADDDAADHAAHVGTTATPAPAGRVRPLRGPDVVAGQRLRLTGQHVRTVGVRDRFAQVRRPLVLRGLELTDGLGEPGAGLRSDAAAAGVDEVRDTPHARLRGEQRLVERPVEPLDGLPLLGDAGQQAIQVGVGFRQTGEGAERVGAAVLLGIGDGGRRLVARRREFVLMGGLALL